MKKSRKNSSVDFTKFDAHIIQPAEYAEIPELTDEWFDSADFHINGKLIKRGRPKKALPKISTTLRLDDEIIKAFRESGAGWQSRINEILKQWLKKNPSFKAQKLNKI